MEIAEKEKGLRVDGYVVMAGSVYPHQVWYWQNAFKFFTDTFRIKITEQTCFDTDPIEFPDRDGAIRAGRWPHGVAVINVREALAHRHTALQVAA
jgi:hypothetical protein